MKNRLSRRELYELVWSKPMREAAAERGISDAGLVKVCRANSVPIPSRGHWNRVHAGKPVSRIEQSPRSPGMPEEVVFGGGRHYWADSWQQPAEDEVLVPPSFDEDLADVLARIRKLVGRVALPRTLASPHALVGRLLEADDARRQKLAAGAFGSSWDKPIFDRPFERRRLMVLNAIFVALAHDDFKPTIHGKEGRETGVLIGKEHVSFELEAASRKKVDTRYYRPHPEFSPKERLKLTILHEVSVPGMQWSWTDDASRIEAQLSDIVVCLIFAGEIRYREGMQHQYEWKVERQAALREHRGKQLAEAERQERIREEKRKQAAIRNLLLQVRNWRRAAEIRAYVDAVRATTARGRSGEVTLDVEGWATWALNQADQIDPLATARENSKIDVRVSSCLDPNDPL